MSLYHAMSGTHPLFGDLMFTLGFDKESGMKIPRLRDIYLYPEEIRILTRVGGGNRDDYEEGIQYLRDWPGYIRDWDDEYDSTYAWFAFKWVEKYRSVLQAALEAIQEERPDLLPKSMEDWTLNCLERLHQQSDEAEKE